MPDVTITAPVAADPIDRLTLGASDARAAASQTTIAGSPGTCAVGGYCMAEE